MAGGIPIIAAISQSLTANQIQSIHAILNGTSNFILTQMEDRASDYAAAVAEAQQLGYAEANPAMDVDGSDAAQKLAILAHLAFGARVNWQDIPRTGIDKVDVADMRYAKELGYSIKLLAVAELVPEGLELHVSPTLVRHRSPLAQVRGAYNAIRVVGDAVGRVFFHGLGAGQMPTASACRGRPDRYRAGPHGDHLPHAAIFGPTKASRAGGHPRSGQHARPLLPAALTSNDRPGVIAEFAGILGRHNISIASIIQHETEEEEQGVVPLVFMTHTTTEGAVRRHGNDHRALLGPSRQRPNARERLKRTDEV